MKKWFALLLAVTMLLCCVACGQKPQPDPGKDNDVSSGTSVDENPVEPDVSVEDPVESTDDTDTTESTDDATESTDESIDASQDTTTEADVSVTESDKTSKTEKTTTKSSTDKTEKTTTKSSADKTEKTTTKSSTKTEKTTTKSSTTKTTAKTTTKSSTKTNSTTKVTTTKSTTTKSTTVTTSSTKWTPNFTTTSKNDVGGITTTSKVNNKGYEFEPGDEWELFWNDEFDGTALDTTKWNCEDGKGNGFTKKQSNVVVQNGQLVITARHENPKDNKGLAFSTGYVTTARKFSFQYGRLEFRARLPYGEGVWPALWTMGDYYLTTSDELGWPVCGEIDVMEMVGAGTDADKYLQVQNQQHTSGLHWGVDRENHKDMGAVKHRVSEGILADKYHVFAIEWDEKSIKFFFDDKMCTEVFLDDPSMLNSFHQKHWIIINLALYNYEPFIADDTTPLPQSMYVDYVRVYKKK